MKKRNIQIFFTQFEKYNYIFPFSGWYFSPSRSNHSQCGLGVYHSLACFYAFAKEIVPINNPQYFFACFKRNHTVVSFLPFPAFSVQHYVSEVIDFIFAPLHASFDAHKNLKTFFKIIWN